MQLERGWSGGAFEAKHDGDHPCGVADSRGKSESESSSPVDDVAGLHQMKLFLDFLGAHVHAFSSEKKLQLADEIERHEAKGDVGLDALFFEMINRTHFYV